MTAAAEHVACFHCRLLKIYVSTHFLANIGRMKNLDFPECFIESRSLSLSCARLCGAVT